ncbi:MAG: type II secretion system protein [Lachnospiraceae bacterium]|nr:type II secretion system protein [Lachnospiraceae bacterium]
MGIRCRECWKQDGFTLIELVVVMALMLFLLAAGTWGAAGYLRNAEFQKQNECARSIFLAAQAELTKRSQQGQLSELAALFADDRPLDVEQLMDEDGKPVDAKQVWTHQESRIYVLEASRQDYARYLEGSLDNDVNAAWKIQALYQLIEPYLLDKTILMEGTIRIELEPSEGLVYGVLYSSHWPEGFREAPDDGFSGGAGADSGDSREIGSGADWRGRQEIGSDVDLRAGRADIADRSIENRKKEMIGYYGVDTLPKSVSGKPEKPAIRSLKLQNKDMLCVSWQVAAYDLDNWKNLTYDITLYSSILQENGANEMEWEEAEDELEIEEVCRISLNPGQSMEIGDRLSYSVGYGGIPKKLTTLDSGTDCQVIQALVTQGGREEWNCFPIILDELQYQITLVLYDPNLYGEGDYALMDLLDEDQAERIFCTVIGYGDGYVSTSMKESNQVICDFSQWTEAEAEAENPENLDGEGSGRRD